MFRCRLVIVAGLLCASVALVSCADETPTYRYRMTVEVETPEGLKTGSSVIEVDTDIVRPGSHPAGYAVTHDVRGEAVTVDLGSRGVLFALLRSEDNRDFAGRVMFLLTPKGHPVGDNFLVRFQNMLEMKEPIDLPARQEAINPLVAQMKGRPMLVVFRDIKKPATVKRVDPDNLAATFGEGVSLRRIRVQMTDDWVTDEIKGLLPWLDQYYDKMLDGKRLNESLDLANNLTRTEFVQGD